MTCSSLLGAGRRRTAGRLLVRVGQLKSFPTGLLAGGRPRESGADRPLIDRARVVLLSVALREPDEGLERSGVRLRVVTRAG